MLCFLFFYYKLQKSHCDRRKVLFEKSQMLCLVLAMFPCTLFATSFNQYKEIDRFSLPTLYNSTRFTSLILDFMDHNKLELPLPLQEGNNWELLNQLIATHIDVLTSTFSWTEADRSAAKRATFILSELAKNEELVSLIVECGAVPALVRHLQAPLPEDIGGAKPLEQEVERGSAFALGLLADKPEHQQLIVDAGALPHLVDLLKRSNNGCNPQTLNRLIRRAADAITNLAHENSSIKSRVRLDGGIPPLVQLLESGNAKVQRAVARALRTLAFKNDDNKKQIVECNALPILIPMLQSNDPDIHYEAVCVIGNLVYCSPNIKKEVLLAGALQPVIGLLSSCCADSQREAALLLGQFATLNSDYKVQIAQQGALTAIPPLIVMLQHDDPQVQEMSAFALGRLARDSNIQVEIVKRGGLMPLLGLLQSRNASLQHNVVFALYGLVDNEDNIAEFIKIKGVQKLQEELQNLQEGDFILQATKDCVSKIIVRLEEKIRGRVC